MSAQHISLLWQCNKSKEYGGSNACSTWTPARLPTASYALFPEGI